MAASGLLEGGDRNAVVDVMFNKYCSDKIQGLSAVELQRIHENIRPDGLNFSQIEASLSMICESARCDKEDLIDVLKEMDRRYFLVNDLKWEFALLDRSKKGAIKEQDAKFLFKMVHGEFFSSRRWNKFLNTRAAKGSLISFNEIEVDLCDIPTMGWIEEILEEEEEEKRLREIERENEEKARRLAEEEQKRKEDELRQKQEAERRRIEEAKTKKEDERKKKKQQEEEEKTRKEAEKRKEEEEAKKLKEKELKESEERRKMEERQKAEDERKKKEEEEEMKKQDALMNWKKAELLAKKEAEKEKMKERNAAKLRKQLEESEHAEEIAEDAAAEEERAKEAARKAAEEAKLAKDADSKRRAEEAEKKALADARANKQKRLRMQLKAATNSRKTERIRNAIKDAKDAKMPELQKDIEDADKVLDMLVAGEKLTDAMSRRHLGDVEDAVSNIKKKKLEKDYAVELLEADKLMNKLRRLERLRREILELNQSTISEIRGYQSPQPAIHQVMIAVYLLLGYKEKELKVWKNIQALLGRTGKEGLKRQVTTLDPSKINISTADYAERVYLSKHDLDSIRDVSAGAATFYVWSTTMVEEARAWKEEDEKRKVVEAQKKKEEAEEKKKEEERRKAREERRKLGLKVEDSPSRNPSMENIREAAATDVLEALKGVKNEPKPPSRAKPTSPEKKKSPAETSQGNPRLSRGRTSVRSDQKIDRSKSQPSPRKASNANAGKRSATPGRK